MATSVLQPTILNFKLSGGNTAASLTAAANTFTFNGNSNAAVQLKNLAAPSSGTDAVTKTYVDNIKTNLESSINGIAWKQSVKVATTSALPTSTYANPSSGVFTLTANSNGPLPNIDGISLSDNDRILVKDQSGLNAGQNGLYYVQTTGDENNPWVLRRTEDANSNSELQSAAVFIDQGSSNGNKAYVQTADEINADLSTTSLSFVGFSSNNLTGDSSTVQISAGAIGVINGGINTTQLANGSVTADKLGTNAVTTDKILDDAVTIDKMANNSVGAGQIKTGAINNTHLFDFAVSTSKISNLNVTAGKLAASSVETDKINNLAVTTDKVNDLAITTDKLANTSVSEGKIQDNAVTVNKIGANAVVTSKIQDDAVTGAKLANDIAISTSGTIVSTHNDGITAKQFIANSDIRLKENVEPLNSRECLDFICELEGCSYNFKTERNKERTGFIAQELEKAKSHLVANDEKGFKAVNYLDMIAYLVEAIKCLNKEVQELKSL